MLVNCLLLFKFTTKLSLETEFILTSQIHTFISVSSNTPCAGLDSLILSQGGKRTGKQSNMENNVPLRTARRQSISNRSYYCLFQAIKCLQWEWEVRSSAMGNSSMQRKLSQEPQVIASTSPVISTGFLQSPI